MRIIKFRGKDIETGKWVYGDLHVLCNRPHIHTEQTAYPYAGKRSFVALETIGQFTGLYDKNSKEIYEGDIVSHPWKDPIFGDLVETGEFVHSTICFNNGAFVVNYRLDGEYIYLQDFIRLKCLEVIGNVFDNPELIEKEGQQ